MAISKVHIRILAYLSLFLLSTEAQNPPCSTFEYLFQPVTDLPCNPYSDPDRVVLKCSIKGPFPPNDTYVTIAWFRRLDNDVVGTGQQLTKNFVKENPNLITIDTDTALIDNNLVITSTLGITVLDVEASNVTGMYWCVAKAGMETPRGNREYISLKSDITMILPAVMYQTNNPCQDMALATDRNMCVRFEVLPPFLVPDTDNRIDSSLDTTTSSLQSRSTDGDLELPPEGPVLDTTMIVILSAIGAVLCVVIHVLLAIVSCLCVKSRRKKRAMKAIPQSRKVSTVSLLKPSNSPPPPPLPQPMILPLSGQPKPTNHLLPSPPTHLPPAPTKKPPVLPQGHRASLPLRFSHAVTLIDSSDDEVYAPIQIKERRAATIAGDMMITTCVEHNVDPFAADEDQCKYKSLNRDMMNNQQVYEDPTMSIKNASDYNIDTDSDNDLDNVYVATILKNTQATPADGLVCPNTNPMTLSPNLLSPDVITPAQTTTLSPNADTNLRSPRVQSPMLLNPTLVPLARVSVDGEYVLPDEAFDGGILSTTEEVQDDDDELPDYIDIS